MNADVRQVLLARAEGSHRYALHLLETGEAVVHYWRAGDVPASRIRGVASMACEQLQFAMRALINLYEKGLA